MDGLDNLGKVLNLFYKEEIESPKLTPAFITIYENGK